VGDDVRVFYDVTETVVEVLAIVPKSEAQAWLEGYGESDETSGPVGTEG
jgi:mRNA interferase RelE/StbE